MKKRKNIIKKIELNKIYKISYKKEFKHYFKESRFKNKFFFKIAYNIKSISKLTKLAKLTRFYILNIHKNFLINKSNYFNYITNNLGLKYNNLSQNICETKYIYDFYKKKSLILSNQNIELIKYQKFITFIENNVIFSENLNFNYKDFFDVTHNISFSFIKEHYNLCYLLILIINCF